jgi:hypothetical protein
MPVVAKAFNSITQRFPVGKEVSESDDFSPHAFDVLKARGFISDAHDRTSEDVEIHITAE